MEGEYINDKKSGKWITWYPWGWRSYEINGKNNESSFILWFDEQHRSSEGFYRDDVKEKTWVWWSREGILDSSGVFNRGIRSGKWTFRDPEANKQLRVGIEMECFLT